MILLSTLIWLKHCLSGKKDENIPRKEIIIGSKIDEKGYIPLSLDLRSFTVFTKTKIIKPIIFQNKESRLTLPKDTYGKIKGSNKK